MAGTAGCPFGFGWLYIVYFHLTKGKQSESASAYQRIYAWAIVGYSKPREEVVFLIEKSVNSYCLWPVSECDEHALCLQLATCISQLLALIEIILLDPKGRRWCLPAGVFAGDCCTINPELHNSQSGATPLVLCCWFGYTLGEGTIEKLWNLKWKVEKYCGNQ